MQAVSAFLVSFHRVLRKPEGDASLLATPTVRISPFRLEMRYNFSYRFVYGERKSMEEL
jgi:hypothetical protein